MVQSANVQGAIATTAEKAKALATNDIPQAAGQAAQWVAANPGTAAAYGVAGVGLGLVVVAAAVSGPMLANLGFTADGIVKGSLAAEVQSGIGYVAARSLFATLESAGMAGYGLAVVNTAVQIGGGALAAGSGAVAFLKSKL
ncbi:hypothetical protein B0H19DRAFT_476439 [Mycena capillaripes]|nr:hypothetical protein B0H19DRAFT_476439 [Mycena capillaripes]